MVVLCCFYGFLWCFVCWVVVLFFVVCCVDVFFCVVVLGFGVF